MRMVAIEAAIKNQGMKSTQFIRRLQDFYEHRRMISPIRYSGRCSRSIYKSRSTANRMLSRERQVIQAASARLGESYWSCGNW
jgi:hypothetical protein